MNRVIAGFALLLAASTATADLAVPGIKRIPYEAKILIEKDISGYAFYAISGGDKATALKLDGKTPATIKAAGGRYRTAELVAVPADAAKKYPTEKEFEAAVAKGKVEGLVKAKKTFDAFLGVKEADTRKSVEEEFKIVKVDAKGITLEAVKPAKEEPKKNAPDESDEISATPKYGSIVSGVAAFVGLALAGFAWSGAFRRLQYSSHRRRCRAPFRTPPDS
jgi:hypothetical protein